MNNFEPGATATPRFPLWLRAYPPNITPEIFTVDTIAFLSEGYWRYPYDKAGKFWGVMIIGENTDSFVTMRER
ncbi:hypothetical protein PHMEG_0007813 [Phytophthora megakarya]|uniref:Uncharacterized protein n=1 Tax=Phytophthora megakarya TaxID=4795 RepID=A0A225WKQ5_9STRA|nr:hypothetical protein PHMEG_0007813 [Phytophthora megakarya]